MTWCTLCMKSVTLYLLYWFVPLYRTRWKIFHALGIMITKWYTCTTISITWVNIYIHAILPLNSTSIKHHHLLYIDLSRWFLNYLILSFLYILFCRDKQCDICMMYFKNVCGNFVNICNHAFIVLWQYYTYMYIYTVFEKKEWYYMYLK